jgi:3-methylcrotonyl-CoA carboxylase alpha subunit
MERAGVPLVPGYHGEDQDPHHLAREAARSGWPVLIKASAGGGGKGMKVATGPDEFIDQLASARREATASFGDDRVLIERYLTRPRHVEIQVFADPSGACVYLFERDCSIQRRHQKVIEEAPAPGMDETLRRRMGEAATAAAKAIGYVGAGTVEFLLDADRTFYFMEMNTRLQVEHPVTELITGQDLVEWQLRVADGEPLPLAQEELAIHGHAIEVRLYAEDPERDFLPQTGRLEHLGFPAESRHVRVDAGVRGGDAISIHYDPMIAKIIAWDADRPDAIRRLAGALADTHVAGLATNVRFLQALVAHPAFQAAELDTGFIERHHADLFPPPAAASPRLLALAALGVLLERAAVARAQALASPDRYSPWARTDGWRLNDEAKGRLTFREAGGGLHEVRIVYRRDGYELTLPDGRRLTARGQLAADGCLTADLEGVRRSGVWVRRGHTISLFEAGLSHKVELVDPLAEAEAEAATGGRVTAPMPGKVTALLVAEGAEVAAGQPLMVLEAMKMEHTIKAPGAGRIVTLRYAVGDQVEDGALLVELVAGEG